jgi:hypothetical protein
MDLDLNQDIAAFLTANASDAWGQFENFVIGMKQQRTNGD